MTQPLDTFNAETARNLARDFFNTEAAKAKDLVPGILKSVENAARRGLNSITLDLKHKYVNIVAIELKALGFSLHLDLHSREGEDDVYKIDW